MRKTSGTIAVLTDEYLEYRKLVIDPITSVLTQAGYGVLCLAGRELDPAPSFHQDYTVCNSIFSTLNDHEVEGVVLLSGALGSNTSIERLQEFASRFTHVPVVSFGIDLDGIPSVILDESDATLDAYRHALSQRKSRKRAFVCGTPNDPYSLAREQRFSAVAEQLGYSKPTHYRVEGNYSAIESYEAVVKLLNIHPDIDLIAAANDLMAQSVVRAAYACNLRVPEDVMVTGFDDTPEATGVYPAITTVRQPLDDAARQCAQLLIQTIQHKSDPSSLPPEQRVEIFGELIMRGSTAINFSEQHLATQSPQELIAQLSQAMSGLVTPANISLNKLSNALWATSIDSSDSIEVCLKYYMEKTPITATTLHWWDNACHQLEKVSQYLVSSAQGVSSAAVITAAIAIVRQQIWVISMDAEFERRRINSERANMQLQMSSCVQQHDILNTMERWLKQTTIERCYLVRYVNPGPTPDTRAQLLHVYQRGAVQGAHADYFESANLLPQAYQQEFGDGILIMTPIHAGQILFGYLLVDPSGLDYLYLDSAAQSIGNALRNQHLIGQLEDQAQSLKSTNQELIQLANFDDLTGLPNRLQFKSRLNRCCSGADSCNDSIVLMFIDLDGFKLVNDTLGHRAGDELLREVAVRLQAATLNTIGEQGFISRLGGDEFTVTVMSTAGRDHIESIAKTILESLALPYDINERAINISASIGMAEYLVDADSVETLVKNADAAMYRAKDKGKNCAAWYTAQLSIVSDTVLQMDADIRMALTSGDLCMHYQPRVHMDSGQLIAAEALMRWTIETPEGRRTRTRPEIFIPIAEQTGFITQLDIFALDQACRQARLWERAGTPLPVAVNISVHHLQQDSFVNTVINSLAKHELSPHLLELEITENAMMVQVETNIEKLHQLRGHGIKLSIDDFGTGFSSLSHLKQLPVNNLKIDKSFIADIETLHMRRSADAAIIKSIIALGRSMDFHIIAEGVESEQQRQFLRALGCNEAQGFLFARPGPANELTELLNAKSVLRKSA